MNSRLLLVNVLLFCSVGLQAVHVLKIKKTVTRKVLKRGQVKYEIC